MSENPTPTARIGLVAALVLVVGGIAAAVAVAVSRDDAPQQVAVVPAAVTEPEGAADQSEPTGDTRQDDPAEASAPDTAPAEPPMPVSDEADVAALTCVGEEWEPTAEELEASRAEAEALAAVFAAAGVDHTIETDPHGFMWVEYDYDDGIAQSVATSYYRALYPEEWAEEFIEPLPAEELERIREENAGLIAVLEAAGVAFELVVEDGGWEWVEWDDEDPAAAEVVDAYYAELYGDEWLGEDCAVEGEEWIPTDEDLAAANDEVDAMAAALDEAGVAYTIEEDEHGWRWVEYDWDDPAAMAALDALWMARSAELAALISADLDRLAAAFDGAGIAYEREGHDECETIIFDTSDPAALVAVATVA